MNNPPTPPAENKGRGCFFYGCLTLTLFFLLACVAGFIAIRWVKNEIATYTDAAPAELPKVQMDAAEFQTLQQQVKTFGDAISNGKPAGELILTERDVNALIARTPDTKNVAGKIYISFTNHQVRAQMSIPLEHIARLAKDRYFNGEATFNVSLKNGVLIVTADQASVRGTPLPDTFMSQLRKENLAKEAYKDAEKAKWISNLESVDVQDGRVVIKARSGE
jgi:hypothetical protein